MESKIFKTALTGVLLVSACSSGGGSAPVVANNPSVQPSALQTSLQGLSASSTQSTVEHSTNAQAIRTNLFALENGSGSIAVSAKSVSISNAVANDNEIEVDIDGERFVVVGQTDSSGKLSFVGSANGKTVSVFPIDAIGSVFLNSFTQTGLPSGMSLHGFDAMGVPTDIAVLNDRALNVAGAGPAIAMYSGRSYLIATRDDAAMDTATGDMTLFAHFDTQTFNGSMDLSSPTNASAVYDVGQVNLTFAGTITGNRLDAKSLVFTPGAQQVGIVDAQQASGLSGEFFGVTGGTVGGNFHVSGPSTSSPSQNVVVQGGFIAKEQ